jgi:hypothetical protein
MNNAGRVGFLIKGDYDSSVTYKFLDVVYYEGSSYVAKTQVTGVTPGTDAMSWHLLCSGVLTDTTLSISERAADAKITGDSIAQVENNLEKYSKGYYLMQLPETLGFWYFNPSVGTFSNNNKQLTYRTGFNTFGAKFLDVEISAGYKWNLYFAKVDGVYSLIETYASTWVEETRRFIVIPEEANRIYIRCLKTDGTDYVETEKTSVFKIMLRGAKEPELIVYDKDTSIKTEYYGYFQYASGTPSQHLYTRLTQDRLYKIADYKVIGIIPKNGYDVILNFFDSGLIRLGNSGKFLSTAQIIGLTNLYSNAAYFRITYRKHDNTNLTEDDYNQLYKYYPYVKTFVPSLVKSNLEYIESYSFNSGDIAVYNGIVFTTDTGKLFVNGTEIAATVGHGNNIMFGKTLDGDFPHLYAGSWYQGQKSVYVNKITLASATLVQTITFVDLPNGFLNMCVDEPNERIYIFMETGADTRQGNILFAIGDFNGNILTSKSLGVNIPIIQGMTFDNGYCYLTSGDGSEEYPNYLYVFTTEGELVSKAAVDLLDEIEGISIDNNTIYIKAIKSLYTM